MRYALVKDREVHSIFESDRPKDSFPDIAHLLIEVDRSVAEGMVTENGKDFSFPPPPPPDLLRCVATRLSKGWDLLSSEQKELIQQIIDSSSIGE